MVTWDEILQGLHDIFDCMDSRAGNSQRDLAAKVPLKSTEHLVSQGMGRYGYDFKSGIDD